MTNNVRKIATYVNGQESKVAATPLSVLCEPNSVLIFAQKEVLQPAIVPIALKLAR